ncbi:MAG: hypothetical protein AABW52_05385 [Nanoarchaeota archaeon]
MSKCNACNQLIDKNGICQCNRPAGGQFNIGIGSIAPEIEYVEEN